MILYSRTFPPNTFEIYQDFMVDATLSVSRAPKSRIKYARCSLLLALRIDVTFKRGDMPEVKSPAAEFCLRNFELVQGGGRVSNRIRAPPVPGFFLFDPCSFVMSHGKIY